MSWPTSLMRAEPRLWTSAWMSWAITALVAIGRDRRLTDSAQVRRDHGVGPRELRHERAPHVAGLGVAMQQHHRVTLADDQIVQPHAMHVGEAALRPLCHAAGRRRRRPAAFAG